MRRRGEEFDADALPAVAGFAEVNDTAFLLFLRFRVGKNNHFAIGDLMLKHEQAAVRVDDHGLADFLELAAIVSAASGLNAHLVKDAGAAARRLVENFDHVAIFGRRRAAVNLCVLPGFPKANLYEGTGRTPGG